MGLFGWLVLWRKQLSNNIYQPIKGDLALALNDTLNTFGFTFKRNLLRGLVFEDKDQRKALIVDHEICNRNYPFSYTEYTKEQNLLMYQYRSVYRFIVDTHDDLVTLKEELNKYLHVDLEDNKIRFTDYDVSKDKRKMYELIKKSGKMGTPQTEIGSGIVVGFDKDKLNRLLNIKG